MTSLLYIVYLYQRKLLSLKSEMCKTEVLHENLGNAMLHGDSTDKHFYISDHVFNVIHSLIMDILMLHFSYPHKHIFGVGYRHQPQLAKLFLHTKH